MEPVITTTIGELITILPALPSNVVPMLSGQPGIGKTRIIKDTFGALGYRIVTVLAGCSDPTDIGGLPDRAPNGKCFEHLPPKYAFDASEGANEADRVPMVIFYDDVVTADPQTQASLLNVVHGRGVGESQLRDNVRIIMAGNRAKDKSAANEMIMALGNRVIWFHVKEDFEAWEEWAVSNGILPSIVGYLRHMPQSFNTFAKAVEHNIQSCATPRTWEMLSHALKNISDRPARLKISCGTVGEDVGQTFHAYEKVINDLTPPEELLKNPDTAKLPTKDRLDLLHATIAGIEAYAHAHKKFSVVEAGLTIAHRISKDSGKDHGFILGRSLLKLVCDTKNNFPLKEKTKLNDSPIVDKSIEVWGAIIKVVTAWEKKS
jgi:hypothetical protein